VTVNLFTATNAVSKMSLIDLHGKAVRTTDWNLEAGDNDLRLELANLTEGVYQIVIQVDDKTFTKRLVVVH
ncbi:MAG: T9SS type A sorting domain-containing protein, partial [Bacteroidia bacterium]